MDYLKLIKNSKNMKATKGLLVLGLLVAIICSAILEFTKEDIVLAKVISVNAQQELTGSKDNKSLSYKYLVGTDKGTYEITPSGLMSSKAFGTLEIGKTYKIKTRGYSFPVFGLYPYIIEAEH